MAGGDEKPAMPEIITLMIYAKERINQSFAEQKKQPLLKKILCIVEKRWETQMVRPLYMAALFFNPGKFFPIVKRNDDALVGELRSCFNDVLAETVLDANTGSNIDQQAVLYEAHRGVFSNALAIENIEEKGPCKYC